MPYGEQILWPDHAIQGTANAALHGDLDLARVEVIIRKGFHRSIDSYSTFFENDRRTPTGLDGWLRQRGFRRLFLVGLATDYCVAWSAEDATRLGYEVIVLEDACRGIGLPTAAGRTTVDERGHGSRRRARRRLSSGQAGVRCRWANILTRLRRGVICSDETTVRIDGRTCWNWVFQNDEVVIHVVRKSRGAGVVAEVLGGHRPAIWFPISTAPARTCGGLIPAARTVDSDVNWRGSMGRDSRSSPEWREHRWR
jgi:hypothetical protein